MSHVIIRLWNNFCYSEAQLSYFSNNNRLTARHFMNKNCIRLDCEEILIYLKAVLSFLIKILSKVHQNNPLFHDFNLYKETKMGQFLQRQMPEDGDCLYVPKVFSVHSSGIKLFAEKCTLWYVSKCEMKVQTCVTVRINQTKTLIWVRLSYFYFKFTRDRLWVSPDCGHHDSAEILRKRQNQIKECVPWS